VYGSTETCITNIVGELSLTEFLEHAPIGFPMQCCQVYVLDEAKLPVPVGQKGELYLVGEAIGKGYINADEQHKIRFVPDPIKQDSSVVFRTGDIVSYDTSGNLFCYGRKAFQVKLNGFSIEPGHIESVLRAIEQVSNAAVVLIEEDQQHRFLVAFVEASENYKPDIIEAISNILPHYMLPQHYCFCDKI
jgi:non-ribosomal peptide synthetase component F